MLRMWYELCEPEDLPGQALAAAEERRGSIVVMVRRGADLEKLIPVLNEIADEILSGGAWFQVWGGEIVSRLGRPEDPEGSDPAPEPQPVH